MDSNEPTAWQDINPPMASPPQPAPVCGYLAPATNIEFRNELVACLTLVAPVGMTEEAQTNWLRVAWDTLKHLPADLLSAGCAEARKTADHPSKIVPAIAGYAETRLEARRRLEREYPTGQVALPAPRENPNYCTPEEAAEILKQYGLKSNPVGPEGNA